MSLSILGGIGAKLGLDLVGSIMEKTLPKAMDFMKNSFKTQVDVFESVVNTFGGKPSKTKPAKQFMMAFPKRLEESSGTSTTDRMKSLAGKLSKLASAVGLLDDVMQLISNFNPNKVQTAPFTGQVQQQQTGASQFGSGMNVDTTAMAESTGYGEPMPGGTEMSPMDMFRKMQEAQQAAQMFEMAVKISEMQHQASMSAIRGIKY
ncbi:hypothetical protein K8T06_17940 [bacterium]|nr:hypothetical protein [bacterium]